MDHNNKTEVVEAFDASLKDLWCNSKVMIQILTQMAAESIEHAEDISGAIKIRLLEVPAAKTKFAVLCLIDSIIKNVRGLYKTIFCKSMVSILPEVYVQVDEGCQKQILKLRQTWNAFFPQASLKILDINMHIVDSSWPVDYSNVSTQAESSEPSTSLLPYQGTLIVDPTVLALQKRIFEIESELFEIKKKKSKLDYSEAQLIQATSLQNTNPSANKLQTIAEETSNCIEENPKVIIPIRDPLLLNHQHRKVNSIAPEVQCSEDFNWENNVLNKSPPCHGCSSIMVTRNETRGTKRRCSESAEAVFYNKIKKDMNHRSCGKEELTGLKHWERSSGENKENCALKKNMIAITSSKSNFAGRYPKARTEDTFYKRPSRWNAPAYNTKSQDHGEKPRTNGYKEYSSFGSTPLIEIRSNGSVPSEDPDIDVHKLFQQLVIKGMINNSTQATTQIVNDPPSVVEVQGKRCHQCGIEFSSEQTAQFIKHLDWHVQQKLKAVSSPNEEQTRCQFPNFADSKSLEIRTSSVIQKLYQGQQCDTCGLRFPSGQSDKYREHIDWHVQQKRNAERKNLSSEEQTLCQVPNFQDTESLRM